MWKLISGAHFNNLLYIVHNQYTNEMVTCKTEQKFSFVYITENSSLEYQETEKIVQQVNKSFNTEKTNKRNTLLNMYYMWPINTWKIV